MKALKTLFVIVVLFFTCTNLHIYHKHHKIMNINIQDSIRTKGIWSTYVTGNEYIRENLSIFRAEYKSMFSNFKRMLNN